MSIELDNTTAGVYRGTKELKAWPMTRGDYNTYRRWEHPANEDENEAGYLVEYLDGGKANDERHSGYISWSPADVFERTYYRTDAANQIGAAPSDVDDWRTREDRRFAIDAAIRLHGDTHDTSLVFAVADRFVKYINGECTLTDGVETV